MTSETRTPFLLGGSGAQVVRVQRSDQTSWIEKTGTAEEIAQETAVMLWCADRLPVARVLQKSLGFLRMTELPGIPLSEARVEIASAVLAKALHLIHALPAETCPFVADWDERLEQARKRVDAGLVDESDFDDDNQGRTAQDILSELKALPPLPLRRCFTHGDACLENFLTHEKTLTGIVDLGRAGVTHPAQDWTLASRSMRDHFGVEGEALLQRWMPPDCREDSLFKRFCLLDELF